MAVDKEDAFCCDNLILKGSRKHYGIPVESKHWQLRSLISVPDRSRAVYIPGGNFYNHIVRLDTETQRCESIRIFPFVPRCVVAKNGWVCCGSESGHFSASRLDMTGDKDDLSRSAGEGEVEGENEDMGRDDIGGEGEDTYGQDESIYLGAINRARNGEAAAASAEPSRSDPLIELLTRAQRSKKNTNAKTMKIAGSRVNCITLWFPPEDGSANESAYDEPVAVLANNDRTVTVVSLGRFDTEEHVEPLDVITYPDYVNRAALSPDGSMLVAVLDDPYLYIHGREMDESKAATSGRKAGSRAEAGPKKKSSKLSWGLKARWLLKSQQRNDKSVVRGSFAACFSNSGHTLAVGTQYGTISIFDAALLPDPFSDPLVTYFRSSRPDTLPGAIRDMAFCPGASDLLAWTEDRGRVGVMDVRSGYTARQMLDISIKDDFENVEVYRRSTTDPSRVAGDGPTQQGMPSSGEGNVDREREWPGGHRHGLDTTEMMLPGSIQNNRRSPNPRGRLNSDSWDTLPREMFRRAPTGTAEAGELQMRTSRGSNSNLSAAIETLSELRHRMRMDPGLPSTSQLRPVPGAERRLGAYRESMAGSNREWQRVLAIARRQYAPPPSASRTRETARQTSARTSADDFDVEFAELIGADLRDQDRETDSDRDRDRTGDRRRARDVRWDGYHDFGYADHDMYHDSMMLHLHDPPIFEVPPSPDNTSGLAWSTDGKILFVAAENGIYEFHVDLASRKFFPSLALR